MTDYETETSTRERDILSPDDTTLTDVPTPEIDIATITHEAERAEEEHPFTPPEPAPNAPPEGGEEQSDNASDGEDVTDRYERAGAGA